MKKISILISLMILLQAGIIFAAPGDVLVEDLHDSASVEDYGTRNIVWDAAQCADGVAPCIKMDCADGNCSGTHGWRLNLPGDGASEITMVWHERYSVWPLEWSVGGCKSMRPYNGSGSQEYIFGLISFYNGNRMYINKGDSTWIDFNPDVVTTFGDRTGHCTPPEGETDFYCDSASSWIWEGMGTSWRKMRIWIKMPTDYTSADGEAKFWVDGNLHWHFYDLDMYDKGTTNIINVLFAPVDESATPHEHWYDEITIYEGYVPPDDSSVESSEPLEPPDLIEVVSQQVYLFSPAKANITF